MRILSIIALMLLAGCGKTSAPASMQSETPQQTTDAKSTSERKEPKYIGPQFQVYDLSGYELVDGDVLSGLGGRWISARYQRMPGADVSRQQLVAGITSSFGADGWTKKPLPGRKYVLSEVWEKSDQDIHFTRRAKTDEPEHWVFSLTVHVSADADVVCLYCEVGW